MISDEYREILRSSFVGSLSDRTSRYFEAVGQPHRVQANISNFVTHGLKSVWVLGCQRRLWSVLPLIVLEKFPGFYRHAAHEVARHMPAVPVALATEAAKLVDDSLPLG